MQHNLDSPTRSSSLVNIRTMPVRVNKNLSSLDGSQYHGIKDLPFIHGWNSNQPAEVVDVYIKTVIIIVTWKIF